MMDLEDDLRGRLTEMVRTIVVEPNLDAVVGDVARARVVPLATRKRFHRRWATLVAGLTAAAAVAAFVGRVADPDPDARGDTPALTENQYFPIVDSLPPEVTGTLYGGFGIPSNPPGFALAQALIARRDGNGISQYIDVAVATQDSDFDGPLGHVDTTASDTFNSVRVVVQPRLQVSLAGTVEIGELQTLLDEILPTATLRPLAFTLPPPPPGYELIAQAPGQPWSTRPAPNLGTDESNSPLLNISVDFNPMPPIDSQGPATEISFNGETGWSWKEAGESPVSVVAWTVRPGLNAYVSGSLTTEQAIAIARHVRFVDEATWRKKYDVTDTPAGPTTTQATILATQP